MSNYSKLKKELLNNKKCPNLYSEDNVIHISINDASEIISPYVEDNKPVINSEFANFLENSTKDISVKHNLILEFTSVEDNKDKIASAIKNYYINEFVDSQRKLKNNIISSIITFIIGLITLSCVIILNNFNSITIINSAVDIFAWVFIWEAVDLFFFRRSELRHQQYRQINFINAKIIFK